jgi:hypothetical protein
MTPDQQGYLLRLAALAFVVGLTLSLLSAYMGWT